MFKKEKTELKEEKQLHYSLKFIFYFILFFNFTIL